MRAEDFTESYTNYLYWRHRLMPLAKAVCEGSGDVHIAWAKDGYFHVFFRATHPVLNQEYVMGKLFSPTDIEMITVDHFNWVLKNCLFELAEAIGKEQYERWK